MSRALGAGGGLLGSRRRTLSRRFQLRIPPADPAPWMLSSVRRSTKHPSQPRMCNGGARWSAGCGITVVRRSERLYRINFRDRLPSVSMSSDRSHVLGKQECNGSPGARTIREWPSRRVPCSVRFGDSPAGVSLSSMPLQIVCYYSPKRSKRPRRLGPKRLHSAGSRQSDRAVHSAD